MPMETMNDQVMLSEVVGIDEADALFDWLQKTPSPEVDMAACGHIHAANLQMLMASRPVVLCWPDNPDLRAWLEPLFETGGS